MIAKDRFPELQCPFGAWMLGDNAVQNLPGAMVDDHEHIENLERRRNGCEKIAGDDCFCVIADEGGPALIETSLEARRPFAPACTCGRHGVRCRAQPPAKARAQSVLLPRSSYPASFVESRSVDREVVWVVLAATSANMAARVASSALLGLIARS